jgi:hypothetical protein
MAHERDHYREVGMDQPAFRDRDGNGSVAMQDIVQAERALIIETFERLKQRGDGELRVSTRRNPRTGICEIIYCGAHEKTDLAPVRRLYEAAGRKTVTF